MSGGSVSKKKVKSKSTRSKKGGAYPGDGLPMPGMPGMPVRNSQPIQDNVQDNNSVVNIRDIPQASYMRNSRNSGASNSSSGNKTTPDGIVYALKGTDGNKGLELRLAYGQEVIADKGALVYMDGDIKIRTEIGTVKRAVSRSMSGEQFLMTFFTGNRSGATQRLFLGDGMIGDIATIDIHAETFHNETERKLKARYFLSYGAFLAGTRNIKISGEINMGLAAKQTFTVLVVETGDDRAATLWVNAYGNVEKHELKADESLMMRPEYFLACKTNVKRSVVNVSSLKQNMLRFVGPGVVYTQSKSAGALTQYVKSRS